MKEQSESMKRITRQSTTSLDDPKMRNDVEYKEKDVLKTLDTMPLPKESDRYGGKHRPK